MPTVGQLPRKASYLRASQASTLDPQPSRLRVCVFLTPRPIATPLPYRFNLYTLPLTLAAIIGLGKSLITQHISPLAP